MTTALSAPSTLLCLSSISDGAYPPCRPKWYRPHCVRALYIMENPLEWKVLPICVSQVPTTFQLYLLHLSTPAELTATVPLRTHRTSSS